MALELRDKYVTLSKRQQSTPTSVPGISGRLLQLPLTESWPSHGLMASWARFIYTIAESLIHRSAAVSCRSNTSSRLPAPCRAFYIIRRQTPSKLPPCMAWFTWTLWAPPRARDRLSGTGSNGRRGVTLRSPQAPAGSRKRPPMDGSMRTWTRCQIRGSAAAQARRHGQCRARLPHLQILAVRSGGHARRDRI
jgi:hypothetical protein